MVVIYIYISISHQEVSDDSCHHHDSIRTGTSLKNHGMCHRGTGTKVIHRNPQGSGPSPPQFAQPGGPTGSSTRVPWEGADHAGADGEEHQRIRPHRQFSGSCWDPGAEGRKERSREGSHVFVVI